MALITEIVHRPHNAYAEHGAVDCTYTIVTDKIGTKYLQLDTYGSSDRQFPGKKSQSIRFSPSALVQLRRLLAENGL